QEVLALNRYRSSETQNPYGVRIGTIGEKLSTFSLLPAHLPLLDVAPSVTNSDKLVESKAEILAEKLTQEKQQSDITAQQSPKADNISVSAADLA
ncbi:MAG: hypothetical protein ACYT04_98280, partial [Nostoc sp.]